MVLMGQMAAEASLGLGTEAFTCSCGGFREHCGEKSCGAAQAPQEESRDCVCQDLSSLSSWSKSGESLQAHGELGSRNAAPAWKSS